MFFESMPITIFLLLLLIGIGYLAILILKKEGSKKFSTREYIGFAVIVFLMLIAGVFAFMTDFGAY